MKGLRITATVAALLPFIVLAMLLLWTFTSTAFGAGLIVPIAGGPSGSLSDFWNIGDIHGGYQTSVYMSNVHLYANLGGQHKIDNSSISISPNYWYTYDEGQQTKVQNGYQIYANFSGTIGDPLSLSDVGHRSQSNTFDARGIRFYENSWLSAYKSYSKYDQFGNGIGDYELLGEAGASISLDNFQVTSANGRYSEYTWDPIHGYGGPGPDSITLFNYNVTWYGDFVPGTVTPGFTAPVLGASVSAAPVPEPTTLGLIGTGLLAIAGFIWRRK